MTITIICETTDKGPHSALAELVRAAHDIGAPATVLASRHGGHACRCRTLHRWGGPGHRSDESSLFHLRCKLALVHATAPEGTIISLANARMKDLLARVAARRGPTGRSGCHRRRGHDLHTTSDVRQSDADRRGGGSVCLSIRSNSLEPMKNGGDAPLSVVAHDLHPVTTVQDLLARASERLDVSEADIIISGDEAWVIQRTSPISRPSLTSSAPPWVLVESQLTRGMPSPTACRLVRRGRRSRRTSTSQLESQVRSNISLACDRASTSSPSTRIQKHPSSSMQTTVSSPHGRMHFQC